MRLIYFSFIFILSASTSYTQINKKEGKQESIIDSIKIEIVRMDDHINSPFDDYAPVITADGHQLFFTSRRPHTEKEKKKNSISTENIYISVCDDNNHWSSAEALPENVNLKGRNNSNNALSNDGSRLLIYQDDKFGNGDVYECILKGNIWSDPVSLGEPINSSSHESSASISPDGKTIYFVSNRPGGVGGRDIWKCTKMQNNEWGKAENLGRNINTLKDEEAVFIHPDGKTLYFSSQGFKSMGGFDVHKSVFENGKWSKPINLGTPINGKGDDLFFVLEASGRKGYYTKTGENGKDLYEIIFTPQKINTNSDPKLTVLKGTVSDAVTKSFVESDIEIIDNDKNQIISTFHSNSATGKFLVSLPAGKNYGIHVSAKGYLFHSENFELTDTASYNEVVKHIFLNKMEEGTKVILRNIFFDTGKSTLRPSSVAELERLKEILVNNPDLKIEISGHTDNQGGDEFNKKLSESRAKAVVDYLISNNIVSERLTSKGYGKTQPISGNEDETGRQQNRRTEFKIISTKK